jgi:hypothetical protein
MAETKKDGEFGITEEIVDMIPVTRVSEVLSHAHEFVSIQMDRTIRLPGNEFHTWLDQAKLINHIATALGVEIVRRPMETEDEAVTPSGRPSDRRVVAY